MTMILHGVGCRTFRPNSRVQDLEDVIQMNRTSRHKIKLSRYNVNPKSVTEEGEEMLLQDATFIKVILSFTLCLADLYTIIVLLYAMDQIASIYLDVLVYVQAPLSYKNIIDKV